MASCSVVFQPQPGVTYTISSGHDIWYNIFPDCYISSGIQMPCYADPEGFYAAGIVRANTKSTSITQEVTGTGAAMNYKPPFQQPLAFASSSAIYTPVSAIITDTSDIMNNNVTVKLTAPSGTTGDLTLSFTGTNTNGVEIYVPLFSNLSTGSQTLELPFDDVTPAIYTFANGTWNAMLPGTSTAQSVKVPDYTLPTPWTYFRKIFYTQYNVPHESQCEGGNTGDTDAWIVTTDVVKGKTICHFTPIKLNSQFIAATWMNGTGIDDGGDILKNAVAVNLGDNQICAGQYPRGAIGHSRADGNTFAIVSSVTGSCNTTLVAGQSVAMPCTQIGNQCPVAVLSGVKTLNCGDQLNLDDGDHTTVSTRTVDDKCPGCSDTAPFSNVKSPMYGADGHIDAFSSNTSCNGRDVGTPGFFYTSYPTN